MATLVIVPLVSEAEALMVMLEPAVKLLPFTGLVMETCGTLLPTHMLAEQMPLVHMAFAKQVLPPEALEPY